jgi:hypothetical protein
MRSLMPQYLLTQSVWKDLWPIPVTAVIIACILLLLGRSEPDRRGWFLVLCSFSILGLTTGVLAGFSRESVLGAVLPPVLSLVGGFAIYLVGKDSESRILVSLCVLALSFNLLIGAMWGAVLRAQAEEYPNSLDSLKHKADIELEIQEYREALGLPKEPKRANSAQDKSTK